MGRESRGGVVVLGGENPCTRMIYHALSEDVSVDQVVVEGAVSRGLLLRRRIRRLGLQQVAGQLLFQCAVVPLLRRACRGRSDEIAAAAGLRDVPIPPERVTRVSSVNADACIETLGRFDPRVVVLGGTRIVSERTLSATPAIFINMHSGITPLYRGVHGGYWALAQGDRDHCGVTVHRVDCGIDTGPILAQARIEPTPRDTFVTYPLLQMAAGVPLLRDCVRRALDGQLGEQDPPAGASRLWSHPTLCQYVRGRLFHGVR